MDVEELAAESTDRMTERTLQQGMWIELNPELDACCWILVMENGGNDILRRHNITSEDKLSWQGNKHISRPNCMIMFGNINDDHVSPIQCGSQSSAI